MPAFDRPRLALYVALGLVVCLLGARYLHGQASTPAGASAGNGATAGQAGAADGASSSVRVEPAGGGRVTVHVAGAVQRPGVYRLAAGARVDDALRSAGGPRGRADLTAVNLAAKLEDGRQVIVPQRAATLPAGARVDDALHRAGGARGRADLTAVNLAAKLEDGRQVLVPERVLASDGGAGATAAGAAPAGPVNLNTATLEQLDTLDGVGPGIAQRILDYREQHGGFRRVEELAEVPGIGAKRLAALTPQVAL